jgi:hypothetical protein
MEGVKMNNGFSSVPGGKIKRRNPKYIIGFSFAFIGMVFVVLGIIFIFTLDEDMLLMKVMFPGMGGFTVILGAFIMAAGYRQKAMFKRLKENGKYVMADITGAEPDYSMEVNGRYPYSYLICRSYNNTGGYMEYKSETVKNALTPYIGRQVRVYYDERDENNYYVDLESIGG